MPRGMHGSPEKYPLLPPYSMDRTAWTGLRTQECIVNHIVTEILVVVTRQGGAD